MDTRDFRDRIATGKGRLEWERKIPDEQINDLKDLLNKDEFDENLPAVRRLSDTNRKNSHFYLLQVINKINQLSYKMFNDLPRGDQKCKSMRKLAGRTLIEVLPPKLAVYLEEKLGDLTRVPDFYDMVGQLSYYGKMPDEVVAL